MAILGINAYAHDASVAVVEGGRALASFEEERFDRVPKSASFPAGSLAVLRERLGLAADDVEAIAFPWQRMRLIRTVAGLVFGGFPPRAGLLLPSANPHMHFGTAMRFLRLEAALADALGSALRAPVLEVEHHLAHAASAYLHSPFDSAAILVMDGFGDRCSTSLHHGRGPEIRTLERNRLFDSLGILYAVVTRHLGFRTVLDEGRTMALAALGSDALVPAFRELVELLPHGGYRLDRAFFGFHRAGERRPVSPRFERRFGPPRHPGEPLLPRHLDLARALQRTLEVVALHVARELRRRTGERRLCLGGGVALNCVANTVLAEAAGFDEVFVCPAPGDSGLALGAALLAEARRRGGRRPEPPGPFLGPDYSEAELGAALRAAGLPHRRSADPARAAARALARGQVVAFFHGRAETGPRALGHRSLLADPRDPGVADRLNLDIKRREPWRPFAPAVLAEHAPAWFLSPVSSPFMSFAVPVRPECRKQIPAVVAADGSARLQTVDRSAGGLRRLLEHFHRETGLPLVLNTSFNVREPTVCTPEDAIRTFARSGIDLLCLGPYLAAPPDSDPAVLGDPGGAASPSLRNFFQSPSRLSPSARAVSARRPP